MAQANLDAPSPPAAPAVDRAQDRANLQRAASLHFVMAMGALTLWGAADAWATTSGLALARAAAIANAIIAATVLTAIVHEWGHLAGARLVGAVSPVRTEPVRWPG